MVARRRPAGVVPALALLACSSDPVGTGDMAAPVTDQSEPSPDLTMPGPTGAPCRMRSDCAPSLASGNPAAMCVTSTNNELDGRAVTWPGGYCQAPCRPDRNDAEGFNPACPGTDAVCVGRSAAAGTCHARCRSVDECRDGYVCTWPSGSNIPVCVPLDASSCDPPGDPRPGMKSCPVGKRCRSPSPDYSYGDCWDVCDPVAQDCPPSMLGVLGCVVDYEANDGSGQCYFSNERVLEGAPCTIAPGCAAGMMCYGQRCRTLCRAGDTDAGARDCPIGQTCKDIVVSGINIKFKKDVTGICTP